MSQLFLVVPSLVLPSLAVTSLLAQNATTSLRGVIKDSSGAVVAGVSVTLKNVDTAQVLTTTSGRTGEYQFQQVTPAKYRITISAPGFGEQSAVLAELLVDQPATINLALTVKSNTETVDVSAAAQTLNTTDAALGGSFNNALIQSLPTETRNVPDLLYCNPASFSCLRLRIRLARTAAAARSMAAVPTRATSRWMVSTITIR